MMTKFGAVLFLTFIFASSAVPLRTIPSGAPEGESWSLIRDFPEPFVQDGSIDYDWDGEPDVAIVVGTHKPSYWVAPEDLKAATMIGLKIGSHLYRAAFWDSFRNVTGEWTGTTLLDEFNRDATPPSEKDLVYEGEDVFSFVRAPAVWMDYEFLDEEYRVTWAAEKAGLEDKNLILIGGPVVNRAVDYLNDTGLLWVLFVGDRLYDTRFYHDGIYEDEGYVDNERVNWLLGCSGVASVQGVGVIQYAKEDPWGEEENYILIVAGNNRYGTLMAAVALTDPTKIVRVPRDIPATFYLAGDPSEDNPFPAVMVVAILENYSYPPGWGCVPEFFLVEIAWPWSPDSAPVFYPEEVFGVGED